MGSFANSALNFMLGWVRAAAEWLWQLVGSSDGTSAMAWLGEHWLTAAVGLCIAGIVIDFMVYLARWRPDLVWRSFMRRMSKGSKQEQMSPQMPVEAVDDPETLTVPMVNAAAMPDDAGLNQSAQPTPEAPRQRRRRADRYGEGSTYDKMKKLKEALFPEEQAVTFQSYKPSKPLGNEKDAKELSKPYIPPQWQKPEE